jgi:hypothetical protein
VAGIGPHRPAGGTGQLDLLEHLPGPLAPLGPAQMAQPPDQLEVLTPSQHRVDGRVLAGRSTLSRIMNSSFSSRRRSEARCRMSCRSP